MIQGIGIDAVEIKRFKNWHTRTKLQLQKLFSDEEIAYCLSEPRKSAERFAVRFAAKEAFLKALTLTKKIPLLRVCRAVSITKNDEVPQLVVDWTLLKLSPMKMHCSLSHADKMAIVMVVVENI